MAQRDPSTSGTRDARIWGYRTVEGDFVPVPVDADGYLKVNVAAQAAGGGAATIIDGGDVTSGAIADVKVVGDNSGTHSAKLRGLNYLLALVTDIGNTWLKVSIQNASLAVTKSGTWLVDLISGQTGITGGAGAVAANTPRVVLATDTTVPNVTGNIAHDGADSGNPIKVGNKAVSFGTNPTEVAANDRTDAYAILAGIPFVLPGHPNVITRRDNYTDAQTNTALITVSGGAKIVILSCTIVCDAANSVKPSASAGFAAATTPTGAGCYISHPGIPAGGGIREAGAVAGADGEDFRITHTVPTGGSITYVTKYFTTTS